LAVLCVGLLSLLPWIVPGSATAASAPTVTTDGAELGAGGTALLRGTVDPNETVLACYAEYGLGSALGPPILCEPSPTGNAPVGVTAIAPVLQPGSTYDYKFAVSYREEGRSEPVRVEGAERSFVTPPVAATSSPLLSYPGLGFEATTSATLQGYITDYGAPLTDCHFEFGPTPQFGSSLPCTQTAGTSTGRAAAPVGALQWGTVYYVQLVAGDAGGTSRGATLSFATPARVVYPPYTPPVITYPPYTPPRYPSVNRYGSYKPSAAAIRRCLRLKGRSKRARCLAALRRRRGGSSGPASDAGLSIYYCPYGRTSARPARAHASSTSEAGWPPKECLKMDKGPAGQHHTIVGMRHVHNWLLGGWGSDTIVGGEKGDVIWADYQACCWPKHQTAIIHAGNGRNVIYANDTLNYVWTGTNPRTVVHAHATGISGVIHCQNPAIVLFLSTTSERHFQLDGCHHISHYSVGY
jgi:hypothetical protein